MIFCPPRRFAGNKTWIGGCHPNQELKEIHPGINKNNQWQILGKTPFTNRAGETNAFLFYKRMKPDNLHIRLQNSSGADVLQGTTRSGNPRGKLVEFRDLPS